MDNAESGGKKCWINVKIVTIRLFVTEVEAWVSNVMNTNSMRP